MSDDEGRRIHTRKLTRRENGWMLSDILSLGDSRATSDQ